MQVKSIAECSLLLTFIKLPFVIKIFVLSVFEWPFYTGFTVYVKPHAKLYSGARGHNLAGVIVCLSILCVYNQRRL